MDIRKYLPCKRPSEDQGENKSDSELPEEVHISKPSDLQCSQTESSTKAAKKKVYKSKLTYRRQWESTYPWVHCSDPEKGMFCYICQKYGKPPANARGAWTSRGIADWNHATEMLKLHNDSKWHKDAAMAARMAEQSQHSVLELQCTAAAREANEKREKNRAVLLKVLRSVYFLVKHRIPHTTTFQDLLALQVANGDQLLEQHLMEGPANAQYTSKFSVTSLIEAIDTWLDRKLMESLKESPFFSILADECEDVSTQEELSICCRWIVNGQPEEHFITILHILACDATTITEALESFIASRHLDYRKLVGQGYDGAAVFSGSRSGVHVRMRTHSAHAMYIHCACHRLQLASVQAAESVPEIKKIFGMMGNIWKLFYYSPKKMEALKEVQTALRLPELKVVKPSDTRWLSHERCMRAIRKELPALITTLQQLYETTGDAEAFGLSTLLASFTGVTSVIFLSEVLDILARMNATMQRKVVDFSKLQVLLQLTLDELRSLKNEKAEWCSSAESIIAKLGSEYGIEIGRRTPGLTRSRFALISSTKEYLSHVAIPYIDSLVGNINGRFSDEVVNLLVATSIFNPAKLPTEECMSSYGLQEIQKLADFYGKEASVEYLGVTYTSPPLLDREELLSEWKIFRRALYKERELIVRSKKQSTPSMQEVFQSMQTTDAYKGIFPQTFTLLNILLAMPVGTATVERSFSQMKMVKTRLRNRLSDCNLSRLMKIAVEGPELNDVPFEEILAVFKEKNRRILL